MNLRMPFQSDGIQFAYISFLFSSAGSGPLLRPLAGTAALAQCCADRDRVCILRVGGSYFHAAHVFYNICGLVG